MDKTEFSSTAKNRTNQSHRQEKNSSFVQMKRLIYEPVFLTYEAVFVLFQTVPKNSVLPIGLRQHTRKVKNDNRTPNLRIDFVL